ncbi:hypothetical protein CDL12_06172 [Handroanthus impetiginosus]|uniref:NPH3 domain-containing protein n=1 Tax=Handroanthus impetiginosus TaxID=429701 RepID=A0A2G9HUJ4_9LAMI|nr:hypothetical protein CDL12_06172 [Handroanthus impetiginosus]
MQSLDFPKSTTLSPKSTPFSSQSSLDNTHILNANDFIKTLSEIQSAGVSPDLIGSIITSYATRTLPELAGDDASAAGTPLSSIKNSSESATTSWMKKRIFIETLIQILPPEKDSISCNFLLRLLRVAKMVGVEADYTSELERRVSWQLDQASLRDLMIPSFSHTCTTLLDFELVVRLVKRFLNLGEVARSGNALMKVAKIVDCFLAEAAVDADLTLPEFVELAGALPSHARYIDDGLYRAIDIYLKAHPGLSKQERKTLFNLIDSRKLSAEASLHAAQNERLPVRAVIQVLLSEQTKLSKHIDWGESLSGTRSPAALSFDGPVRCLSKREMITQQMEIKRLKEDVLRLQSQCMNMERQIEKMLEKKKGHYFSWKKLGIQVFKPNKVGEIEGEVEGAIGLKTPKEMKARLVRGRTSNRWRESL